MAKVTIDPGNLRKNQPAGEHITRIMYDDNEPPKNYIWGKPDGFLYVWNGVKWVLLNDKSKPQPVDFPAGPSAESIITNKQLITKPELDTRLKLLKTEIVSYLTKLINMKDCPDSGDNAIVWFREEILPEINRIKDQLDTFATKSELASVRQELLDLIDGLSSSAIVSELIERIEALEGLPHDTYVTKDELLDAISDVASSQTIININNTLTALDARVIELHNTVTSMQGDITNIKNDIININANIDNNAQVTSAALNDLNTRILNIEQGSNLGYVTAEEVTDIHSIII